MGVEPETQEQQWEREFRARVASLTVAHDLANERAGWEEEVLRALWCAQPENAGVSVGQAMGLVRAGLLEKVHTTAGIKFMLIEGMTLEEALRAVRVADALIQAAR